MSLVTIIDSLLYEEEGTALDFKSEQYRFVAATDDEKSEILKDILAFANAWRRSDAYIVIGVKEVKGGKSEPLGVKDHLDDANLQQFVNSKTQRPIDFSYKIANLDGRQIGVVHIPIQRRPFYLTKAFGKLQKNVVYIRRGSSTAIATIDEIASMGNASDQNVDDDIPLLSAFLVTGRHDEVIEKRLSCDVLCAVIPKDEEFPDYGIQDASVISFFGSVAQDLSMKNKNFYRQYAKYVRDRLRVQPFKLAVKNEGKATAKDVKVVIDLDHADHGILAIHYNDLPDKPSQYHSHLPKIHPHLSRDPRVSVRTIATGWQVTCYLGKIQAKDIAFTTDRFCLSAAASRKLTFEAKIFADDLKEPKIDTLEVSFEVKKKVFSVADFVRNHEQGGT